MATTVELMTVEEYALLPDDGRHTELVRGEVIEMAMPTPRHGDICFRIAYLIQRFLDDRPVGRPITNDSGVITERDPDTMRGADVAYYSYESYPRGPLPKGYLAKPPEVVFEVRSPSDRWPEILEKVVEYLAAGVKVVCVADDETSSMYVYRDDRPIIATGDAELTLPELHADFRVPVRRFFE